MSSKDTKDTMDSDIYGDIYGDEDFLAENEPLSKSDEPPHDSVSYSAQVAQQFSQYQQSPTTEASSKTPGQDGAPPAASTSDSIFGKKPSEMHDEGKLFIGGLSWDTTDEGLRDYFNQFGKVDAVTIMRDNNGTSRGFAFLTFEDANALPNVLAQDHVLDGKAIDPKRAIPREEHLRNTRYFVGGIAPHSTSDSMKAFFSTYGKVVDATVMLDRESGRSKGFGFVTFEDSNNSELLIGKHLTMDDKQIEVKLAQPRSQREQAAKTPTSTVETTRQSINSMPMLGSQNPMASLFQRSMQMNPMMMNPMMMNMMGGMGGGGMGTNGMAAGMGGMGGMGGGMGMGAGMGNGMGAAMGGMGAGAGMGAMGGMNPMMMNMMMNGMGGMGGLGAMGGMGGMRAGVARTAARPVTSRMGSATGTSAAAAASTSTGGGPARVASRGQHNFHPYSR